MLAMMSTALSGPVFVKAVASMRILDGRRSLKISSKSKLLTLGKLELDLIFRTLDADSNTISRLTRVVGIQSNGLLCISMIRKESLVMKFQKLVRKLSLLGNQPALRKVVCLDRFK
jgi:hypothetical protein